MKKLEMPDVAKGLEKFYRQVDSRIAKYGELTSEERNGGTHEYRD
ncbi:MAG: hypothetical protein QXN62_08825 [Candidatus Bathyarchaeia archaeon]